MYSGERNSLSRSLKHVYTWALSSQSEDALNHSRPIIMAGDISRRELEREYGRQIVAQSLTVWNGLTKAVEKNKTTADIVVRAKLRQRHGRYSKVWSRMTVAKGQKSRPRKTLKDLSMDDAESMKEYIARAKSLALNVKYHDIEITEQEISRRVLNGLPPSYAPEKRNFALKTQFSRSGGWSRSWLLHATIQDSAANLLFSYLNIVILILEGQRLGREQCTLS